MVPITNHYIRDVADEMVILTGADLASLAQHGAVEKPNFLKRSEILDEVWQALQSIAKININILKRGGGRLEGLWKSNQLRKINDLKQTKTAQPT